MAEVTPSPVRPGPATAAASVDRYTDLFNGFAVNFARMVRGQMWGADALTPAQRVARFNGVVAEQVKTDPTKPARLLAAWEKIKEAMVTYGVEPPTILPEGCDVTTQDGLPVAVLVSAVVAAEPT
jgi:hypothetical protein